LWVIASPSLPGHNFLYSVIHPAKKDHIIALERNYYPKTMERWNLVPENVGNPVEEFMAADDSLDQSKDEGKLLWFYHCEDKSIL